MLIEHYRRLYLYERESHFAVIEGLKKVPTGKQTLTRYGKAVGLLAHLAEARRLWLHRFGEIAEGPKELFPQGLTLTQVEPMIEEIQNLWKEYLDMETDDGLSRSFEYEALDGGKFRNSRIDILTQLHGHSMYHRGQIAILMRAIEEPAVPTDFVYWTRELLDGPEFRESPDA